MHERILIKVRITFISMFIIFFFLYENNFFAVKREASDFRLFDLLFGIDFNLVPLNENLMASKRGETGA